MLYYTCIMHVKERGVTLPRNKYPEETVQKILDASLKLFSEKGYEETTVLDIIDNMGGMTRGAFYHHFKSKEDVLNALRDRFAKEATPFDTVMQRDDLNGLEKLRVAIMETSTEQTDRKKFSLALMPLLESPAFLKMLVIDTNRDSLAPACQRLIEEGGKDGSIKVEDPKLVAEVLVFLINFWNIPSIFPMDEEETWKKFLMIKNILDGIGLPIFDEKYFEEIKEKQK